MSRRKESSVQPKRAGAILGALLVVVALAGAGLAAAQQAEDGPDGEPQEIDECTVIDEPGTYVLAEDIEEAEGTCIEIAASGVVLDGQGNTISGVQNESSLQEFTDASLQEPGDPEAADVESYPTPDSPQWNNTGVAVVGDEELSDVTVQDLGTTDLFFGVYLDGVSDATVWNVEATGNGDGLEVYDSENVTVADTTLADNEWGAFVVGTENSTFWNVTATNSSVVGVNLADSHGNAIVEGAASDGGNAGYVLVDSHDNAVFSVEASGNGAAGIGLFGSDGTHVEGATVADTAGEGEFDSVSTGGIALYDSADTTIEDVEAADNADWAYVAEGDSGVTHADDLAVDGRTVSFQGTDVAINSVEAAPVEADEGGLVGNGLVVTDTGERSWVNVQIQWGDQPEMPAEPEPPEPVEPAEDTAPEQPAEETPEPDQEPEPAPAEPTTPSPVPTPPETPDEPDEGNETDGIDGNETDGADGNETDDPDGNETDGVGATDGNETDAGDGIDGNETDGADGNETDGTNETDAAGTEQDPAGPDDEIGI